MFKKDSYPAGIMNVRRELLQRAQVNRNINPARMIRLDRWICTNQEEVLAMHDSFVATVDKLLAEVY